MVGCPTLFGRKSVFKIRKTLDETERWKTGGLLSLNASGHVISQTRYSHPSPLFVSLRVSLTYFFIFVREYPTVGKHYYRLRVRFMISISSIYLPSQVKISFCFGTPDHLFLPQNKSIPPHSVLYFHSGKLFFFAFGLASRAKAMLFAIRLM